jgi:class 3 adenylate cyclase
MGITSLRAAISATSAFCGCAACAVLLAMLITASLSDLRTLLENHDLTLLREVELPTFQFVHLRLVQLEMIHNHTRSAPFPLPSSNWSVYMNLQSAIVQGFHALNDQSTLHLTTRFVDGTVMRFLRDSTTDTYASADRVRAGILPFVNDPSNTTFRNYVAVYRNSDDLLLNFSASPQWARSLIEAPSVPLPVPDPAAAQDVPAVTGPHASYLNDNLIRYLQLSAPVFTSRKGATPFGTTTTMVTLLELRNALENLRRSSRQPAVVLDEKGYVLAGTIPHEEQGCHYFPTDKSSAARGRCTQISSLPVEMAPLPNVRNASVQNNTVVCQLYYTDYDNGAFEALDLPWFMTIAPGEHRVERVSTSRGPTYFAGTHMVYRCEGFRVYIVQLLYEEDFIHDMQNGMYIVIGLSLGILLLVAIAAFWTISLLLAPLARIAERMMRAAHLEDNCTDEPVSVMSEVAKLQLAYYGMNEELNRIRSFVPQAILAGDADDVGVDKWSLSAASSDAEDKSIEVSKPTSPSSTDLVAPSETRGVSLDMQKPHAMPLPVDLTRAALRQSRKRSKQRQTRGDGAPHRTLECYLNRGPITVLAANLSGFHNAVFRGQSTAKAIAAASSSLVDAIARPILEQKGVLLSFHGDHFSATFNAARKCPDHAAAGALVAIALISSAPDVSQFGLKVCVGVATGTCLVGNVGSVANKAFCAAGPAHKQASLLERLTRLYGAGCQALVSPATARGAVDVADHTFLDVVLMPHKDGVAPMPIAVLKPFGVLTGRQPSTYSSTHNDDGAQERLILTRNECARLLALDQVRGAAVLAGLTYTATQTPDAQEACLDNAVTAEVQPPFSIVSPERVDDSNPLKAPSLTLHPDLRLIDNLSAVLAASVDARRCSPTPMGALFDCMIENACAAP